MTDATAQTIDRDMTEASSMPSDAPERMDGATGLRRALPLAILLTGAVAAAIFARDYLSFQALAENRETLLAWRDANYLLAAAAFGLVYAAMVAFSVPGAVWLTIGGGFLFGTVAATSYTVVAATIGATAIFLAAKHGLGDMLRAKAHGWLRRFEDGVRDNDVSFMLVMRLVPAVPFFVANLAPAFLGVRTRTYIWTTLVGIIPGTAVYASIGAGLGEVFEYGETPDLGVIFEPHVFMPLVGLAALAALPAVFKLVRRGKGG